MNNTIKLGCNMYQLEHEETVMDNGIAFILINRGVIKGFREYSPHVSKKEFKRFKENPKVRINTDHNYGKNVVLWTYYKNG